MSSKISLEFNCAHLQHQWRVELYHRCLPGDLLDPLDAHLKVPLCLPPLLLPLYQVQGGPKQTVDFRVFVDRHKLVAVLPLCGCTCNIQVHV